MKASWASSMRKSKRKCNRKSRTLSQVLVGTWKESIQHEGHKGRKLSGTEVEERGSSLFGSFVKVQSTE